MRFVDGDEGNWCRNCQRPERIPEVVRLKPFWRYVAKQVLTLAERLDDFASQLAILDLTADADGAVDTNSPQVVELVINERQDWIDDDRGAGHQHRGKLKCNGFAVGGWEQDNRILACERARDRFILAFAQIIVPENVSEKISHVSRGGVLNNWRS